MCPGNFAGNFFGWIFRHRDVGHEQSDELDVLDNQIHVLQCVVPLHFCLLNCNKKSQLLLR